MAKNICKKRNIQSCDNTYINKLGYSLIEGASAKYIQNDDGITPLIEINSGKVEDAITFCTSQRFLEHHIDIFSKSVSIVFDIGQVCDVETIAIGFFCSDKINYNVGKFELYASNKLHTIFNKENLIANDCGYDKWVEGGNKSEYWVYDTNISMRYFGIKILESNLMDDIIRLKYIGLFNSEYTEKEQYFKDFLPENLISDIKPIGVVNGKSCFDIKGNENIKVSLKEKCKPKSMWIIADGEIEVESKDFRFIDVRVTPYGYNMYNFNYISKKAKKNIELFIKGNCRIDVIGISSNNYKFNVDIDNIINNDFLGVGANVIPMSFMPESVKSGYNEVYWALERERILKTKPNVVRLWFQPDWIVENYADYKNGVYDFNTQKMESVYKYLDLFLETDTEIEFNFGWKVSTKIQEWFSFEGSNKRASAPRELDLFAKCCAATLYYLIKNKGYYNIKYLTFYNEPDYGLNSPTSGDFCVIGYDRKEYWAKMLQLCRQKLDEIGLFNIKIWGCETSGLNPIQADWIKYFSDNKYIDMFTSHKYAYKAGIDAGYVEVIKDALKYKPFVLSEFGQCYSMEKYEWERNNVQLFIDMANLGVSGLLIWCLCGMVFTDPCNFMMRNFIDMWDVVQIQNGINNVREPFYELAMLCNYVPNHSKTVSSYVISGSDNARIATFVNDDDVTVVVELKQGIENKKIDIEFNKSINKKFYKHVYKRPCCRNGDALLPPSVGEIYVDTNLIDSLSEEYQEVVYTTIAPIPQVKTPSGEIFIEKGKNFLLSAELVDCTGEVLYDIVKQTNNGFTLQGATIIASEDALDNEMCAVRIYSKKHPKNASIVIVKIKA